MSKLLDDAIEFASNKHEGQFRKGSKIPYIVHPYDVMQILKEHLYDEEIIAAGILHDTLENTNTTKTELMEKFGERIATFVEYETEDKSKPYKVRKKEHMKRVSEASIEVKIINCADKLANLKATQLDLYNNNEELYWKRFNETKEDIKWYYGLAIESLKELKYTRHNIMYQELKDVYNDIFTNNKNINFLSKLFNDKKDKYTSDNYEVGEKLFKMLYNKNFIKQFYQYENKKVFDVFYGQGEDLKFYSSIYKGDRMVILGYRNGYGYAMDDYFDPAININDFEILKMKHVSALAVSELNEKYVKYMEKQFGEPYKKAYKKYEIAQIIDRENRQEYIRINETKAIVDSIKKYIDSKKANATTLVKAELLPKANEAEI